MNILSVTALTEIAVRAQARHKAIAERQRALLTAKKPDGTDAGIEPWQIREWSAKPERDNNIVLAQVCAYRRYWPVANDDDGARQDRYEAAFRDTFDLHPRPHDPSYA
jgi:hypothetical protein